MKRNKALTEIGCTEPNELVKAPHTFVIHRGKVGSSVLTLVKDVRRVMEPYTASSLKVTKRNKIKDFVAVAGILHVSHFCIFTRTEQGTYLRVGRVPRGPTLSFKVHNYTLACDVISTLKKQYVFTKQFEHPPLIVLNGFTGEGRQLKLMASTFQHMFPSINLIKVDLSSVRRVVLINYDSTSKLIDFRHYAVRIVPVGVSKSVKKLLQNKVPDLSRYNDVSEFITNPVQLSESEADDETNQVVLPQKLTSRGNLASNTSAIRVVEIGPRLTLQLMKAESGFLKGDVLFHDFMTKTEREKQELKKKLMSKIELKAKRRRIQEENVRKKEVLKAMKEESLNKKKKKSKVEDEELSEDNDVDWYKKEVGEEPEAGTFNDPNRINLKRKRPTMLVRRKKVKENAGHKFSQKRGAVKAGKKRKFS